MNQLITKYKVALIQNQLFKDKSQILNIVKQQIVKSVEQGCKVCLLGEFFNTLFQDQHLAKHAEDFSDKDNRPTYDLMQQLSQQYKILLIGGLPEKSKTTNKLYNSALAFYDGELLSTFRKCHLFNVDIPGGIKHTESDQFDQGDSYSVFDTPFGRFGIGICYDIRFPAFSYIMREKGCQFFVFPSAFNQTTGPRHWELLCRSRALDQQVYVAGTSAARYLENDVEGSYQTYGHSMLVDPMGQIMVTTGQDPDLLISEVDLDFVNIARNSIPTSKQRRIDLYKVTQD